jgi:spore coat protein U-like protein
LRPFLKAHNNKRPIINACPVRNPEGEREERKMKKTLIIAVVMLIALAMATGAFAAGSTNSTVNVSGTVAQVCVFGGAPTVAFGTVDASVAGPYPGTVTPPTLWCTKGYVATAGDNGGQNFSGTFRLKSVAGDYIAYSLTYNTSSLTGQGKSTDIGGTGAGNLAIVASIPAGAIDNAPAGLYSDVVTLTINY